MSTVWYVLFGPNIHGYRLLLKFVKESIISGIQHSEDDQPMAVLRPQAMQDCLRSRTYFMPNFVDKVSDHLERGSEGHYLCLEYGLPRHVGDEDCSIAFTNFLVILIALAKTWQRIEFPSDLDDIWDHYGCYNLPICNDCKQGLDDAFSQGRNDAWEELCTDLEGRFA